MELLLQRDVKKPDFTLGLFSVNGQRLYYTVEDEDREEDGVPVEQWKVPGKTCIPRGRYQIEMYNSPHFGMDVPHLLGVPGFEYILIHWGNTAADTEGCIIVGLNRMPAGVSSSKVAALDLIARVKTAIAAGEEVWITVEDAA